MEQQPALSVPGRRRKVSLAAFALLGFALLAIGTGLGAYRYFVFGELQRAQGRLSLYHSTVVAEVERFEHLSHVMSIDPFVISRLEGDPTQDLDARLHGIAAEAGLDAIYLMRLDGETIAASNAGTSASFIGENYGFRPYFQDAASGTRGRFYGIGATTGLPGYFIADPVRRADGTIIGVVAIKISLAPFEESWRAAGEEVFLTNVQQVVLLASDPAWRYRTLGPLSGLARAQIGQARQFTGQPLDELEWTANDTRARINGERRLYVAAGDLPHGWQLHYMVSGGPAVARALVAAGVVVTLAGLALIFWQFRKGRRLGAALRRSEAEEAELRRTNDRLALEIEDRRRAEQSLRETREELERASRLAALGQLAASVTHELGQPISAMRNHVTAHELSGNAAPGKLVGAITGLVDRMEGITRQLKFFARSDVEPIEDLDLRDCLAAVFELMAPSLEQDSARVTYDRPDTRIAARGSRLRLEQVLTNLMKNALDAMEESADKHLQVSLGYDAACVWVEVADTGHGLGEATLTQLREPFFTTRASGDGMGLGLAISSGIVDDHAGRLTARNRADGGAVFRMELPLPDQTAMAAQ